MTKFETLEISVDGPVGRLWLNRPDRLNAMSITVLEELKSAAQWFDQQKELRAVIVGGHGRSFCAGADISGFPAPDDPDFRERAGIGREMAAAIEGMRAVTIARIQGWCIGGGLVLVSACDLRIAEKAARFSIPEVDLGIPLGWGGLERLVRDIGPTMTKELIITCREFDAKEARKMGLLNRTVDSDDLEEVVADLADSIAAKARLPVIATKREVNAVAAAMVGLDRNQSDADSLYAAFRDPECQAVREAYVKARGG